MTFAQLVSRVRSLGQFDVTEQEAKDEVNLRYLEMVVEAKWRRASKQLGTTVAGQSNYALPDADQDLELLSIGGQLYFRVGQRDMQEVAAGGAVFSTSSGYAGAFAPDWDASGGAQVEINPAPDVSGTAIMEVAVLEPPPLVGDGDVPIIPSSFHAYIADGAIASFLAVQEERQDLAQWWESRFQDAIRRLRRRQVSRVGSGPVQFRVAGVHFAPSVV